MRLQRPRLRPRGRAAAPASRARLPQRLPLLRNRNIGWRNVGWRNVGCRSIGWRSFGGLRKNRACRATPTTPADASCRPARRARNTRTGPTTLFVLDTNVLLHDPSNLFRFEEHDIFLPMVVLEELDNHKRA